MRQRGLCCAVLPAVAVGVAAGGRGGGATTAAARVRPAPACAHAKQAVDRPAEVPAAVLPRGTVLTSVEHRGGGMTLVTGIVSQGFRGVVDFYVTKLPAAGYQLGAGDAEMDEAEAAFVGSSLRGKWKVNGLPNCPGAVALALYVRA